MLRPVSGHDSAGRVAGSAAASRGLGWAVAVLVLGAAPRLAAAPEPRTDIPPGHLTFRVFGGAEGLHNQAIHSIAQDRDGFLWIATDNGVDRFDGAGFSHFSTKDGLLSGEFTVLGVAPDGGICAGNDSGLVCWDGTRFSRTGARGVPALPVVTMASTTDALWIGTKGGGLYVRRAGGDFVAAPGWPGSPTTTVSALWADAEGLVAGHGATVELTAGSGAWRDLGEVGLDTETVEGVLRDPDGALWIRTTSHLWLLPKGAARARDLHDGLPRTFESYRAPATMVIGPRGNVLVATDDGVSYRDRDHWRTIDASLGLPRGGVRTMFVDVEGTLWLGSAGLYQLRGRGIIEHYDAASGLPGETAWMYAYDRQQRLLIGTNRCLARADAGQWRCVPGTEHRYVTNVVFPPQGGVFVGGEPSDVLYIDDNGHVTSLGSADVPARPILGLTLGPEGDLWIGKWHGLYRLRGAIPGPIERVELPGAPADTRIASLVVVGDQLWITAMPGGIFLLDHGTWRHFGTANGFLSEVPYHLIARSDGRLCTTYNEPVGMTCFRYNGTTVTDLQHLATADGLTSDTVYFLGEDRAHRLWVGTGDGVDVVTPSGIDHLDATDGLVGNDSAGKAFFLDPDGSVWLGATGGATHVFAQYYRGPPAPPRVTFLRGRLGELALHNTSGQLAPLEVPHDHSALTLEFGAGSLLDPKRVEYEARFSPQEVAWSPTHQRELRYPALLPGSYRLEARARIDSGPWGPIRELRFSVLPAWWQTRWFIVLSVASGLLVIVAGTSWRQRTALQRRTRQLNAQSEASLRTVIDRMPELISVYRDGPLTYLNVGTRRLLGVDRPDGRFALTELAERVHADDLPQVTALLRTSGDGASPWESDVIELRLRDANGSWRVCEVSAARVEIGGAPLVLASGRDVTERNRLRSKLQVSDRMASLGTLAAGIAHEINNPLSYVAGNLEVIAETLADASAAPTAATLDDIGAAISDARDGAERVRKIVLGLRSFSHSEPNKLVAVELAGVIETAIRMAGNEIRHRAQLVRALGPTPPVLGDDGRLTQVFINLLTNAAHSIPEGRTDRNRITVRTSTSEHGHAVIEIEDTGVGMTPEVQARVFDPFFTTKDVGAGTGLGLSICHGIIESLGGQISIESPPGTSRSEPRPTPDAARPAASADAPATGGTVVRVVLRPYVTAAGAAAVAAPAAPGSATAPGATRRLRVLVVDDEPLVAETVARLLRQDHDVTIATRGEDALSRVTQGQRFDAIVSDVMMPTMSGIELHEALQRLAPEQAQRMLFLSGGAFTEHARNRLDQLGAPQLAKPITAAALRSCVQDIAARSTG
jgi:PAS domain S-box-containing protein